MPFITLITSMNCPLLHGVIDVTIPYSELTELLSPGGVITRYFTTK